MQYIRQLVFLLITSFHVLSISSQQVYTVEDDSIISHKILDSALFSPNLKTSHRLELANKAQTIFNSHCDLEMLGYTLALQSTLLYQIGNFHAARNCIYEALQYTELLKDSLPHDHFQTLLISRIINDEFDNKVQSIEEYGKLITQANKIEYLDTINIIDLYMNYGILHKEIQDYRSALNAFKTAQTLSHNYKIKQFSINLHFAKLHLEINEIALANQYIENCYKLLQTHKNKIGATEISSYHRTRAQIAYNLFDIDSAINELDEAVRRDSSSASLAFYHLTLSTLKIPEQDKTDNYKKLFHGIRLLRNIYEPNINGNISKLYNSLCELIDSSQIKSFIDSAYHYNTYPDSLGGGIHMKNEYLRTILLHFKQTDSIELLHRGVQLIHDIRHDINSIESKHSSSTRAREFYDIAISAASRKYMNQYKNKYFKMAFHWADISKGGTLNEQIYRNRILRRYADDSLYRKCHTLQSDIHSLRKEIISQQSNSISENNSTLYQLLLEKANELNKLEDSIKFIHPLPSTDDLYNSLQPRQAILQTYVSNEKTYFFTLTSEIQHIKEVRSESIAESISILQSYLSDPNINQDSFINLSHRIYNQLFSENINWKAINELIIIPDQFLNRIPFESLIITKGNSIKSCKYLFQETTIQYSLGLHLHSTFEEHAARRVLAIAPNFEQTSSSHHRSCSNGLYGQLLCNKAEVGHIESYFETEYLLDNEASLFNLTKSLPHYNFIHLATHACIDTSNYYNSAIILNNERVSINDLYNFNWHNKTIILSACNTGNGKEIKGEGVFNFARILTELGAKEIIVSLWPIDDCSTADFFNSFYEVLPKSSSTAEALQKARMIHFHESDKLHSQPYFWAPLILISNQSLINDQLPGSITTWSISIVIFVGLLLLAAIFISRKKLSQTVSLTPANPQSA